MNLSGNRGGQQNEQTHSNQMINVGGQVVWQSNMQGPSTTIDVSSFHGLFLITACAGIECHTARLMID
jgi:hypothetical protein